MKKSILQASFEESLNLEHDTFRDFNKKTYEESLKYFENGGPSTKFKITYFLLSLLFPIGACYLCTVMTQEAAKQGQFMGYQTLKYNLLPTNLYLILFAIWLGIILLGKRFNQQFILVYRMQFHIHVTSMLWVLLEGNMVFLNIYTPTYTVWGSGLLMFFTVSLAYLMLKSQLRRLKGILYGEFLKPDVFEKFLKSMALYGMGILGLGVVVNIIIKTFSVKLTNFMEYIAFSLCWPIMNIAILALVILLGISHFLPAYYKLKYPEQYRQYEGKSLEEWYGLKYLKKHKELIEHE